MAEQNESQDSHETGDPGNSKGKEQTQPTDTSYYGLLGVHKEASQAEIKGAYRRLARELHPDVNPDSETQEKFKEISQAYQVLSTEETRRIYDETPSDGNAPFNLDDILTQAGITDPDDRAKFFSDPTIQEYMRLLRGEPKKTQEEPPDPGYKTEVPGGGLRRTLSSILQKSGEKGHQEAPKVTQEDMTSYTKFVVDTLSDYSHIHPPAECLKFMLPNGKEIFVAFKDAEFNYTTMKVSGKKYVIGEMRLDPKNDKAYTASGIEVSDDESGFHVNRVTGEVKPDQFMTFGSDYHFNREKWQYPHFEQISGNPVRNRDLEKLTKTVEKAAERRG
jgi:hypothetical protein